MQLKPYISLLLVALLIILLTAPAISANNIFTHSIAYRVSGFLNISSTAGEPCRTGAFRTQQIRGDGELRKSQLIKIAPYIMRVEDETDWATFSNAIRNLTVITKIQLCAPPMYTISEEDSVYRDTDHFVFDVGDLQSHLSSSLLTGTPIIHPKSDQLWRTSISTNPGHQGSYHARYIAAYGPGPFEAGISDFDQSSSWWPENNQIARGDYYVGNFFDIKQYIFTSSGDTKRLIDISSPDLNRYLFEELHITGYLTIREYFVMNNVRGGPDAITFHWSELF